MAGTSRPVSEGGLYGSDGSTSPRQTFRNTAMGGRQVVESHLLVVLVLICCRFLCSPGRTATLSESGLIFDPGLEFLSGQPAQERMQ